MRRESGAHTGASTPSGRAVSRRGSPPPAGITYSCGADVAAARRNATQRPSGETAGALSRSPWVHVVTPSESMRTSEPR
ncbi:hypothetical protein ACFSVJ_29370 [Prauserella oleivorans]